KNPLGSDQIIAEYICLLRLLLTLFVKLLQQQTQSLMSPVITHVRPFFLDGLYEFALLPGYLVRLTDCRALRANRNLDDSDSVAP
ncbi:MAG: hypothetical protein ACYS0H_27195, partial [Planctomycetota bacterium]